jgi:hypothetical protein
MTVTKVTAPKQSDLVSCTHQEGICEVLGVNTLMQTANIRLEYSIGAVRCVLRCRPG